MKHAPVVPVLGLWRLEDRSSRSSSAQGLQAQLELCETLKGGEHSRGSYSLGPKATRGRMKNPKVRSTMARGHIGMKILPSSEDPSVVAFHLYFNK